MFWKKCESPLDEEIIEDELRRLTESESEPFDKDLTERQRSFWSRHQLRVVNGRIDECQKRIAAQSERSTDLFSIFSSLNEAQSRKLHLLADHLGLIWKDEQTIPAHWEKKPKQ